MLLWLSLLLTSARMYRARPEYFAVCDAGSTGTRLYVFELDAALAKAKSVFVKKTKPGLSSYADDPAAAVPPLLKLLIEGADRVPEDVRSKTPLAIFGTAGIRMLAPEKQDAIWEAVRSLGTNAAFPFAGDRLEARAVSGIEEGLWAVYNANFLTGRMSHDLKSTGTAAPLGLMDLGGSSTQIAIPAASVAKAGEHFGKDAIVHSYLGFGMTYIREQVRQKSVEAEDAACYMKGTPVDSGIVGTGNAPSCRMLITKIMRAESKSCQTSATAEKPCLGDLAGNPGAVDAIKGTVDFYAVAGMTYVVDFVHWWLTLNPEGVLAWCAARGESIGRCGARVASFIEAYPRPSLAELATAADAVCAGDYSFVAERTADKKLAHAYTGLDNAPYRCFQANYILALLGEMYGFREEGRSVTFLLDVDGEDLEWPLGALLHQRSASPSSGKDPSEL